MEADNKPVKGIYVNKKSRGFGGQKIIRFVDSSALDSEEAVVELKKCGLRTDRPYFVIFEE